MSDLFDSLGLLSTHKRDLGPDPVEVPPLPDGMWVGHSVIINSSPYSLSEIPERMLKAMQALRKVDFRALLAERNRLKAAGSKAAWTEAVRVMSRIDTVCDTIV